MTIGKRIKTLRENRSISQTSLADKIGVSKQTLYKYENDIITNIPSDKIELIANVLSTSPGYLMGWEDKKKSNIKENEASSENADYQFINGSSIFNIECLNKKTDISNLQELVYAYSSLNSFGKKEALKRINELTELSKYTENKNN